MRRLIGAVAVAARVAGGGAGAAPSLDHELVLLAAASGSIDDASWSRDDGEDGARTVAAEP